MTDWTAKPYIAPNTLHCVDAFELLAALPDASVDMCLTDMPYGEINNNRQLWKRREGKNGGIREIFKFDADTVNFDLIKVANEVLRITKNWIIIFCGTKQLGELREFYSENGLMTRVGTWQKTNPSPLHAQYIFLSDTENFLIARKKGAPFNGFYQSSVFSGTAGYSKRHPTEKPEYLFKYLIEMCTNAGDLVIDPFVGSGTTAVAAHITGRRFICGDQSPEYIEIARRRVFPEFGKPPKRAKEIKPLTDLPLFEGLI